MFGFGRRKKDDEKPPAPVTITMQDLTVPFQHVDGNTLVEDWRWLIGPSLHPILVTASGDAFLQDANDGTVHVLDTVAGEVSPVAGGVDELRALLGDRGFVSSYLAVDMISDLKRAGRVLGPRQVYGWKVPPALGGEVGPGNVEPTDMEVHFSLTGQIHEQIRQQQPGTPVSGATLR
jgi:hypothetical protein